MAQNKEDRRSVIRWLAEQRRVSLTTASAIFDGMRYKSRKRLLQSAAKLRKKRQDAMET